MTSKFGASSFRVRNSTLSGAFLNSMTTSVDFTGSRLPVRI